MWTLDKIFDQLPIQMEQCLSMSLTTVAFFMGNPVDMIIILCNDNLKKSVCVNDTSI